MSFKILPSFTCAAASLALTVCAVGDERPEPRVFRLYKAEVPDPIAAKQSGNGDDQGAVASSDAEPAVEQQDPNQQFERAADWKLEWIRCHDGKLLRGLILSAGKDEIEFAEIIFPKGRPMFAVVHPVDREVVKEIHRLSEEDRAELERRYSVFKNRALIEAGRMDDLELKDVFRDGALHCVYSGDWFQLESTADEETTRRSIVRIEQIFRAYRQVLPPRGENQSKPLRIVLHGSMDAYRDDLQRRKLHIDNPAYYSPQQNLIVAGSELAQYAQRLSDYRARGEALREQIKALDRQFSTRLRELADALKQNGFTEEQIRAEVRARKAAWKAENGRDGEYWETLRNIETVNRRNDAKFAEITQQMFRRLYHEAFHAYVENFVNPRAEYDMPLWLNEGLAQIFENAQLDADVLRIDAPDRKLLARLQADLVSEQPMSLETLLNSQDHAFVAAHNDADASNRHYLYAWGLAYYLAFEHDLLGQGKLDGYVANEAQEIPPVPRFEKLVGEKLPKFEQTWHSYILKLKPPKK